MWRVLLLLGMALIVCAGCRREKPVPSLVWVPPTDLRPQPPEGKFQPKPETFLGEFQTARAEGVDPDLISVRMTPVSASRYQVTLTTSRGSRTTPMIVRRSRLIDHPQDATRTEILRYHNSAVLVLQYRDGRVANFYQCQVVPRREGTMEAP